MNGNPLVSIITPCYNGEKYLARFLDSIVAQTYDNLEFIFINDGSVDKTENIFNSYISKFKDKNIKYRYVKQVNQGQAAAINAGLKYVSGKYITWPDSDDVLYSENISKKVEFLEKNQDCSFVMCQAEAVDVNMKQLYTMKRQHTNNENLFKDLVVENNVFFAPGLYMISADAFFKVNSKKEIIVSKTGQNWQMLLPMAYHYKCGYIDEILYKYVVHRGSHSRSARDYASEIERFSHHENLLNQLMDDICKDDCSYFKGLIKEKYSHIRLKLAWKYNKKDALKKEYTYLESIGKLNELDKKYYRYCKSKVVCGAYQLCRRLWHLYQGLVRRN
ncbi:MAG: glycosyltransferase [Lachnospiraceae bacterium]|nr:glycosyltransferase [Lachnospiraceae bacterium]